MNKSVPIKDFRIHLADFADKIEAGESFVIIRRSKKSFRVVPVDMDVEDEGIWETVIDFTDGGKKKGEKIEDVISVLKDMDKKKSRG